MAQWPNSPRNQKTGPGSRGGTWHLGETRAAYFRDWRRRNTEYREREKRRKAASRARARRPNPSLTEIAKEIVRQEVAKRSMSAVARELLVEYHTVFHWLHEKNDGVHSLTLDAIYFTYGGMKRFLDTKAAMRRLPAHPDSQDPLAE